ncbi:hypothetical protein [Pseudothauera lacus]|uniref:hypothetical protein n=1 Tax=Pseudothauera lacus TaxID=2136175 RepID=UPI0011B279A1|nr:hypothetical protein [Pseudothauera lacus]
MDKKSGAGNPDAGTDPAQAEEVPSRRTVLRGALLFGCGMWVPIALSGCDSRQPAAPTNTTPAAAPPTGNGLTPPPGSAKTPKTSVQYQTQPRGEEKCNGCRNFIAASNECAMVEGQISAEGWCSLWTPRA